MNYRIYLLLFALVVAGGCGRKGEPVSGERDAPVVVTGVTVTEVGATPEAVGVELSGTVRARTSAVVAARVAGTVTLLKVREGDRVKKGELLARLEARETQAAALAAAAGSDEARRALDEAVARKKLADATFGRYQQLFAEQAVTRQEFDIKQMEKEVAAQGVARAEARLSQARELSTGAGTLAGYSRVTAPISGVITARQVDPGSSVFPSQPLFTVEDEGSYFLEIAVPESLLLKVKPGMPVRVSLDAVSGSSSLPIGEIVPAADPVSRTFIAKIPLSAKGLRSGMFGRAEFPVGGTAPALLVAKDAVVERGALTSVWVVDKDKVARMRLVKVGKTVGDRVEIISGLSSGERVVTAGAGKVSEGARVE
jgi:RND family efflux transporter MFP subunit